MQSVLDIVRNAYENYSHGRLDAVMDCLSPDVAWRSVGTTESIPWAGDFRGRDVVRSWFESVLHQVTVERLAVQRYIVQDDRAVVLAEMSVRFGDNDEVVRFDKCDVLRIADGKIVEFTEFYDTAKAAALLARHGGPAVTGSATLAAQTG